MEKLYRNHTSRKEKCFIQEVFQTRTMKDLEEQITLIAHQ